MPGTTGGRVLGIDEAGRGSFVGPLVVGGFLVEAPRLDDLVPAGAADSKTLTPKARELAYAALGRVGEMHSVELSPATIDRHVVRGALNELEARAFADLVRATQPDVVYLDACDPNARRFGAAVRRRAGTDARIVARHKADRDFPVVGAASIVAKVRRDRAVAELARALGETLGSGYPSDPATVDCVRRLTAGGAEAPSWVRASWATMQRIMPARPARSLEAFGDDGRGGPRVRRGPVQPPRGAEPGDR